MSQKTKLPPTERLITWENPVIKLIRSKHSGANVTESKPVVPPVLGIPKLGKRPKDLNAQTLNVAYINKLLEHCHERGYRLGSTISPKTSGWWSSHIRRGTIVGINRIIQAGHEEAWAPIQVMWWFDMGNLGQQGKVVNMWPDDLYVIQSSPTIDAVSFLVNQQKALDLEENKKEKGDDN